MAKNYITKKAEKEYLKSPNHCPFCGSDEISASNYDDHGCDVMCICGKKWAEIYKIIGIVDIN